MIVYNDVPATEQEKEEALRMVLEGFKQQDQIFLIWRKINQVLRSEYRQPINEATKGYNIALGKSIELVNQCFNDVINEKE